MRLSASGSLNEPQRSIGILECFYGDIWTEADRRRLMESAAENGAGYYVYGPAGDERTGSQWRREFSEHERQSLTSTVRYADELHLELVWRVSPMCPLDPDSGLRFDEPRDSDLLERRISQICDAGIRTVLLCFDDIQRSSTSPDLAQFAQSISPLAAAQADLSNRLHSHLAARGVTLVVCPTEYWGTRTSPYRQVLSSTLASDIRACWTGPDVVSSRITAEDVESFAAIFPDRNLWLWDNFPVNDWGTADILTPANTYAAHLLSGPIQNRSSVIFETFEAYLINASASPALTSLTFATAESMATEGGQYRPHDAWMSAVSARTDDPDTSAIIRVTSQFSSSPLSMYSDSAAEQHAWRLMAAIDERDSIDQQQEHLRTFREDVRLLRADCQLFRDGHAHDQADDPSLGSWLYKTEKRWIDALERTTEQAVYASDVLLGFLQGDEVSQKRAAELLYQRVKDAGNPRPAESFAWAHAVISRALRVGGTSAPPLSP